MNTTLLCVMGVAFAALMYLSTMVWTVNSLAACLDVQSSRSICENIGEH